MTAIKPTHKALDAYYRTLQAYADQQVRHEGALETAFQQLLSETARSSRRWMLVPKLPIKRGGKTVIPDGTLRDEFNLPHGYWEAKSQSTAREPLESHHEFAILDKCTHSLSRGIYQGPGARFWEDLACPRRNQNDASRRQCL